MTAVRLEMRLDASEHDKLVALAERDPSLSDAVRRLIDEAYEVLMYAKRREAIERIANADLGPPPELDELRRLVNEAASPAGLH
jgi:hypothetical protein